MPSEPVFVPAGESAEEGEGFVLSLVYDGGSHRSYVAVFDGQDLAAGPRCKVWFDQHIPFTFHGNWVDQGRSASLF
jgi:carotenoid cleavage dioxygenase-like enzyme